MLKILYIILFRISPNLSALCSNGSYIIPKKYVYKAITFCLLQFVTALLE